MSYVLDALKKADAERERGSVPGLHAQPVPLSPNLEPTPAARPWVWTLVGALVAVLVGLIVWRLLGRDESQAASAMPAAPAAVAPAAMPATVAQAPVNLQPATAPPQVSVAAPTIMATARRATSTPAAAPKPATAASVAKQVAPPAAVAASAAVDTRLPTQAELPEDLRRGLPTLAVGGSIYSDSPAGRFLIINGQIFHEGDKLAPDLVLVQIRLKLAVLSYKGTRFSISY